MSGSEWKYWILMFRYFLQFVDLSFSPAVARSGIIFAIFLSELSSSSTSEDLGTSNWFKFKHLDANSITKWYLLPSTHRVSPVNVLALRLNVSPQDKVCATVKINPWPFPCPRIPTSTEEADWFLTKTPQGGKKLWQTGSSVEIYLHFLRHPALLQQGRHWHCSEGRKMKLILTWYSH